MRYQLWLLRKAAISGYLDGCLGRAKAAAYSGMLSFIPVLTVTFTILVQLRAEEVSLRIADFLYEAVPPGSEMFIQFSFAERGQRPLWLLIVAGLVSLVAASGLMMTLMEGFRAAYRLNTTRGFVKDRIAAILLIFVALAPVVSASALLVFGDRLHAALLQHLGWLPEGQRLVGPIALVASAIRYLVALSAIALGAALLYYIGPNRIQRWRFVWPGAVVATLLWLTATLIFAWYVRNIANYNVMYGSLGAVIALLVWMYVLAVVALVGCEYNAIRERLAKGFAI